MLSAIDSPDPVTPGNNVTYTVMIRNNGPDAATNGGMNAVWAGMNYVSASGPAGFTCSVFGNAASCTHPAFASGTTATFTLVLQMPAHLANFADGSTNVNFSTSGTTPDPNNGNNSANLTTSWDSPQMDLSLTVSDSPDPVTPNNDITYTVPVANAGPDAATSVNFNVYNNGSLRFQSVSAPAGWSCAAPSVGSAPIFTCSTPSFAGGTNGTFTVVVRADPAILGINDGTVSTAFSIGGTGDDTNDNNNSEQEDTQYVTPDADMTLSVSDSPDPVTPNNDITYTINVGNSGPDTATNAQLAIYNNGTLRFQSVTAPAGWTCSPPSVGSAPIFNCSNPSFASGGSAVITVVVRADPAILGVNDGTVSTAFSVSSAVSDPVPGNNSEQEDTAYITPDANLGVTATDSPDPVAGGANITYSGNLTNAGPDAATSVTLTAALDGNLLFQSLSGPAGFTCNTPAAGAHGTVTCTIASLANGASVPFTLVAQVNPAVNSGPDGTISQMFTISSGTSDPTPANNSVTVPTTYTTPDADISVTNTDAPDPVAPGGTITYTQSLTNGGPQSATNVVFSEVLPASVGFQSLTAPAGWACATPAVGASGTINCTIATLASGTVAPFLVTVNVIASSGTVSVTATGDSDTYDPDPTDNSATATTTINSVPTADLSVTKNTAATSAPAGSTFNYTIVVTNNGPNAATTPTMTDTLPASLLFVSLTRPSGWTCTTPAVNASGTINCTAATLANGASATFTLTVRVASNATSGNVTNTASASSATADSNGGNSSGSSPAVPLAPASADVSVTKTTASTTAPAGSTFSYTIQVANAGPSPASNVVMTDTLPASLQFQSLNAPAGWTCTTPAVGASGTITCSIATLNSGVTATFTLAVRVASNATSGTVTNTATVTSATADPDSGDHSAPAPPVTLAPSADLSLTKTTPATYTTNGSILTYTLTVSNAGPSAATNVVLTDTLPSGLSFVDATPSQGTCNAASPVVCNLGTIASGASATVTLRAQVTATSGTISNSASVTASESDPDGGDNASSSTPIPVGEPADLEAIPTLSEWALMGLAMMLGLLAMKKVSS